MKRKHPTYFPRPVDKQSQWLINYTHKLAEHATELNLPPADVTVTLNDVGAAVFAIGDFRSGVNVFYKAAHERIDEALYGTEDANIIWPSSTPSAVPAAVKYGCLNRVFTYIELQVRTASGYNKAIGLELGIEPSTPPAPDPLAVPDFHLRTAGGGKLEVVWIKGPYDGVKLQFDLGAAGIQNDIDLHPNYILNWLPAPGTTALIKVRLMYILKGHDTENWSEWKHWTLTGM